MMRGGTLLILGHGVTGQGQLCPPARGCHALLLSSIIAWQRKIRTSMSIKVQYMHFKWLDEIPATFITVYTKPRYLIICTL